MKKIIMISLLILICIQNLVCYHNEIIGCWISNDLDDSIKSNNSIYGYFKNYSIKNPLVLFIENINKTKYKITFSYDLHDSGFNFYNLYSSKKNSYLSYKKNSAGRFEVINKNLIKYKGTSYKKIYCNLDEFNDCLWNYFDSLIFNGQYIDLQTNDTIDIKNSTIFKNNISYLKFHTGIDFLDINFDYIILDLKKEIDFSKSIYSFSFKDCILYFNKIILNEKKEFIISDKVVFALKRINI